MILLDRSRVAAEIATAADTASARGDCHPAAHELVRGRGGGSGYPISRLLNNIRRLVLPPTSANCVSSQPLPRVSTRFILTMHGSRVWSFRLFTSGMNPISRDPAGSAR